MGACSGPNPKKTPGQCFYMGHDMGTRGIAIIPRRSASRSAPRPSRSAPSPVRRPKRRTDKSYRDEARALGIRVGGLDRRQLQNAISRKK